jgi:hypothetical protein
MSFVDITPDDEEIKIIEPEKPADLEILNSNLQKTLEELNDIRNQMQRTFSSSSAISSTIQNLKGVIDQMQVNNQE